MISGFEKDHTNNVELLVKIYVYTPWIFNRWMSTLIGGIPNCWHRGLLKFCLHPPVG
jgi:hypothetical protein